jgi:Holliday junction resolvase RusA-like endonuclease
MVEFFIPITPIPKGRPRFSGRGGFVRSYTPAKTRDYEKQIADFAREHFQEPLQGPLAVSLTFTMPIPSSTSKKLAQSLVNSPHTKKPDVDNLCKSLLDGLLQAGAFNDDSQIWELTARKVYGLNPGVLVRIA